MRRSSSRVPNFTTFKSHNLRAAMDYRTKVATDFWCLTSTKMLCKYKMKGKYKPSFKSLFSSCPWFQLSVQHLISLSICSLLVTSVTHNGLTRTENNERWRWMTTDPILYRSWERVEHTVPLTQAFNFCLLRRVWCYFRCTSLT